MAGKQKKGDGFFQHVSDFFKRVQQQDLVNIGGQGKINMYNSPQSDQERKQRQELQIFRQYLQNKNWNLKHVEYYDEYRRMDATYPIINAALRLYSQEVCYDTQVVIQFLDGSTKTLEQIINSKMKNFWIWGYDNDLKKIIPVKCEKAISKGFKEIIEIKLDDGTILKCTPEHKHLLKSGEWKEAKDLKEGDSLRSIYSRINQKGYLELSDGEVCKRNKKKLKYKKAHSIVANEVNFLKEQKISLDTSKYESKKWNTPVCHHISYNKLNNDPNYLEWMLWKDHELLHQNSENQKFRWKNLSEEERNKRLMRIRKARKDFWNDPEKAEKKSNHHSKKMKEFYASMTKEERSERSKLYTPFNENHNWWNRKRFGKNNANAHKDKLHFEDFSIEFLDENIPMYCDMKLFCNDYNCTKEVIVKYKKFKNVVNFWDFSYFKIIQELKNAFTNSIINSQKEILGYLIEIGYKGVQSGVLGRYVKKEGFKDLSTFVHLFSKKNVEKVNHKVVSITYTKEVIEVGDIVNAGNVHNFAIKCNEGMVIVHNCITGDSVVTTSRGPLTIRELYDSKKTLFYVESYDPYHNKVLIAECNGVINNGIKDVYEVTVVRNIDEETSKWDKIQEAKFKCTDNHKIMIAPGVFKELKDLKPGDTIFGFYKSIDPSCGCKIHNNTTTVITSIEYKGQEEVFDLFNVSPNHNFSLKLTDSFHVFVHNCSKDADGKIFKVVSDDKAVKKCIEECFYDNLKLDSRSYLYVRSLLKFGNLFGFLQTRRGVGVTDIINLPPEALRIILDSQGEQLDQFVYQWYGHGGGLQFDPWEIVHWKIIEDIEQEPYGQSILRSIIDVWRRIILMREALIIYRVTRAPQRFLYKIDTTGLDPDSALRFAEQMKKNLQKKPLVNPVTGEIDFKIHSANVMEDFFMPTYEGDLSNVSILDGASNLDAIEDYKIIKDDLFAGLLIPKSYLTFEEDLCLRHDTLVLTNEGKMTIKEISDSFEIESDKKVFVLSCNDFGFITDGKILWCKPTKKVDKLYRIYLSNNKFHDTTDNHPFLLEDLTYKRADELKVGNKIRNIYEKDILVIKIDIIELDTPEYVYDLEVEKYHNFALDSGIFVHNSNKAALSQEDLRFNNAVKQYQSYYVDGLLHIAMVHLYMNGYSKDELESFKIEMQGSSTLAERTKLELLGQRVDLAKSILETSSNGISLMSYTQVMKQIMKLSDEEIAESFKNQLNENKLIWRLNQLRENGFWEEPDPDKKKAKLMGLDADLDIFKELQFEAAHWDKVEKLGKEKLNEEINHLVKPISKKVTRKQIDNTIGLYEDKIKDNIRKTYVDLRMKSDHLDEVKLKL